MNTTSKPTSSNQRTSHEYSSEESGWTVYFEDFLDHKTSNEHMRINCSSGSETSSLVSDAASLARKRSDRSEHSGGGRGSSMVKTSKRSFSFKERKRTGRALVENALVDTASSPISMNPKVCDMNDEIMDMDAERNDIDHANISQEKVVGTSGPIDERSAMRFVGRDSDCT
ncbi:hypothetical protein CIPAW_11G185600 [Carya illinoinensis]|uniref:Uncharacterized protein n=2 Tax=Carya illinoinensis TaxID=32201 RepID=A0A8T1P704_CARIL|nr:hypothetical protein CIPAW_11G185600 [Carya illinoinensis]